MSTDHLNKHTFYQDGVKLSWIINDFIPMCGGREALEGVTTKDVLDQFIKKVTSESESSYAIMLRNNRRADCLGQPNVLVSHVFSYQFLDTIDALAKHHRNELEKIVVWWDLFSMNHHADHHWDSEWLATTLKEEIGNIGRVVMVMSPWNDPLPYRDAWCVFVAFCALTSEKSVSLEAALSAKEHARFVSDFHSIRDETAMKKMMSEVRKDRIGSHNEEDKEKLLTAIGGQVTIGDLEVSIFDHFRSWIIDTLHTHMHSSTQHFGALSPEALESVFALALLYKNYGLNSKYVEVLHLPLEDQTDNRTPTSMDLLKSRVNLASVYAEQARYKEAEFLYRDSFNKLKDTNGNSKALLAIINNMGLLYEAQELYKEAEELFHQCYDIRKRTLGGDDKSTLRSMLLLANVHRKQGDYKKAEVLGFECNEKQQANLGMDDPDTARSFELLNAIKHEIST